MAKVRGEAPNQSVPKIARFQTIRCHRLTKDQSKYGDNVGFAIKSILDGLVVAVVLAGDGRRFTWRIVHDFSVDKIRPRVAITQLRSPPAPPEVADYRR
jgi:hypothetical protein